jgi:hypothetical protein
MPGDICAKPLWNVVAHRSGFVPRCHRDLDLKRVLSGLYTVVDRMACFRTHDDSVYAGNVTPIAKFLCKRASQSTLSYARFNWPRNMGGPHMK